MRGFCALLVVFGAGFIRFILFGKVMGTKKPRSFGGLGLSRKLFWLSFNGSSRGGDSCVRRGSNAVVCCDGADCCC